MKTRTADNFEWQYQTHLKQLKLKGLQPKTIETYARINPADGWLCRLQSFKRKVTYSTRILSLWLYERKIYRQPLSRYK